MGFDIVEVAPAYYTNGEPFRRAKTRFWILTKVLLAEITSLVVADIVHDFLSLMLVPPRNEDAKLLVNGRDEL